MAASSIETRHLHYWNILDFQDGKSRFVGIYTMLRDVIEIEPLEDPYEEVYYEIVGVACISSPIVWFNKINNIGNSQSGREYVLKGPPTLPTGELRRMIIQKFSDSKFNYRYSSTRD